jgi:hypothetical protein
MEYLGRFQQGDTVTLSATTLNGSGAPVTPDTTPTAAIYRAGSTPTLIETVNLPAKNAARTVFQLRHRLGGTYNAERHFAIYRWVIATAPYKDLALFDVLSGGDQSGNVISMFHVELPTGDHILYQNEVGNLLDGRTPT